MWRHQAKDVATPLRLKSPLPPFCSRLQCLKDPRIWLANSTELNYHMVERPGKCFSLLGTLVCNNTIMLYGQQLRKLETFCYYLQLQVLPLTYAASSSDAVEHVQHHAPSICLITTTWTAFIFLLFASLQAF